MDSNGRVLRNLQDPSPKCFAQIANVVEHKGTLYFGSIGESAIGRMESGWQIASTFLFGFLLRADHAFGRQVGITLEIVEVENYGRAVVG